MKDNKNKQWFINTDHITYDRTIQLSGQHVQTLYSIVKVTFDVD